MPPPARGCLPTGRRGSPVYPYCCLLKRSLLQLLKDIAEIHFLSDDSMEIFDLHALLLH